MALHQLLCGVTAVILLSTRGSCQTHSPTHSPPTHSPPTHSPPTHSPPPLPKCGMAVRNTRIVGGQDSSPGAWPWQVDIHNREGHVTGGSLISDSWVLTNAFTIIYENTVNIKVYLGSHSHSGPNPNETYRAVERVECHPYYDGYSPDNDICLLELSSPVEFNDYIQPVCLASAESTFHTGTKSWVTGWGITDYGTYADILQEVNVRVVGNNECRCTYPQLTENMMCAGAKGKDACTGDAGSALVTKTFDRWVGTGIVSFGEECGEDPGGYTRLSRYEDFIRRVTNQTSNTDDGSLPGFITHRSMGKDSDSHFTCPTAPPPTTEYPPPTTEYPPHTTKFPPHTTTEGGKGGGSIFDSGENLIRFSHFTHFFSLGGFLVLSFYALV